MLKMSTAFSTTQTIEASRRESVQVAQGDFSVSAPQVSQKRMRSRAIKIVSARCRTTAESACTRCNATRSAERGPMPGNLASAEVSETMGSGNMTMQNQKLKNKKHVGWC